MGLSSLNDPVLFDPIRLLWVRATPEERVRQRWIQHMLGPLGFPKGLVVVEKPLKDLVHLQGKSVPDRRLDLLCYAKGIHPLYPLYPLLLIECKADPVTEAGFDQLVGYNHHVGAPFIAAVCQDQVRFAHRQEGTYRCYSFLPAFQELMAWASL